MGRLNISIPYWSDNAFTCKCCYQTIGDPKKTTSIDVESPLGRLWHFSDCINYILSDKQPCYVEHTDELILFDPNPIFIPKNNLETCCIYCLECNYHLGWTFENNFLILKDAVV